MASDDRVVARGFLTALEDAVRTGDHESVLELLGDFAYVRKRRIELTIRDGEISRYEIRSVG